MAEGAPDINPVESTVTRSSDERIKIGELQTWANLWQGNIHSAEENLELIFADVATGPFDPSDIFPEGSELSARYEAWHEEAVIAELDTFDS